MPFDSVGSSGGAVAVVAEMERLLTEKGWCQGAWENSDGYCLIGALNVARGREPDEFINEDSWAGVTAASADPVADVVIQQLQDVTGATMVSMWNDNPFTRKSDVMRVLAQVKARLMETPHAI